MSWRTRLLQLFVWKSEFVGNKAKMRILKRVLQENKARQTFRKRTFLTPFGLLCSLVTPILRFALLPYYRRSAECLQACLFFLENAVKEPKLWKKLGTHDN